MEFAAVGDNVNLASRIMGLNPSLGSTILISEDTYYEVFRRITKPVRFQYRGLHDVKGRQAGIKVYEVTRMAWET